MRLKITKTKNSESFYVITDIKRNGKRTTKIVEKLGTLKQLNDQLNGEDPYVWAKKYVNELNKKEQEGTRKVLIKKSQTQSKI